MRQPDTPMGEAFSVWVQTWPRSKPSERYRTESLTQAQLRLGRYAGGSGEEGAVSAWIENEAGNVVEAVGLKAQEARNEPG